jgi:hypothetical protein
MRKPKEQDEESNDAQFFEDFDSEELGDDEDGDEGNSKKQKKPARQRVELRNEQQSLRRQLSDWDDYEQEDFDIKL